MTTEILRS